MLKNFWLIYQGIPFKKDQEGNSLLIISGEPATVEAEDFDDGGEGVSFHFQNAGYGGYDYREEKGVAVSKSGDVVNIGNVSSDDWLCYTYK